MELIKKLKLASLSVALLTVFVAPLSQSGQLTDAELAMLPEYCMAKMGSVRNETARESWTQRMGRENFVHLHHYCVGLDSMNKAALEFNPKEKKFILQKAIRNFDYVLSRWPREFSLTSSAASYRQQAQMMLSIIQ